MRAHPSRGDGKMANVGWSRALSPGSQGLRPLKMSPGRTAGAGLLQPFVPGSTANKVLGSPDVVLPPIAGVKRSSPGGTGEEVDLLDGSGLSRNAKEARTSGW